MAKLGLPRKIQLGVLVTFSFCVAVRVDALAFGQVLQSEAPALSLDAPRPDEDRDREHADLCRDATALRRQGNLLKRVVKFVSPSVVHINAQRFETHRANSSLRLPIEETGSGVIVELDRIDHHRYILTNLHVVRNTSPDNIRVQLADGRVLHPSTTWADSGTDLAVLEVSEPGLVPAEIGDSNAVEIGDYVLAFGSPFGLSHSVTFGIISAKGRRDLELGSLSSQRMRIQEFLQTDAAINPGNSGGPLANLGGEVIGINTAIASNSGGSEGIGFSIPINMAMVVAQQLVDRGSVTYAYLGVHLDSTFTPSAAVQIRLPHAGGARVTRVTPGSPAEAADLRAGDVIMRFGDIDVEDDTHLVNMVSLTPVGKQMPVLVYRDGKAMMIDVTVSERRLFER